MAHSLAGAPRWLLPPPAATGQGTARPDSAVLSPTPRLGGEQGKPLGKLKAGKGSSQAPNAPNWLGEAGPGRTKGSCAEAG